MTNDNKIDVLDGGFVRLLSYMQPHEAILVGDGERVRDPNWSADLEIVRNARVSFDADWRTGENAGKDEALMRYLYKNKHTSPFEAMVFTFEIQVPIFIARQWHRHRTWSYNEVSARYTTLDLGYFIPDIKTIGVQSGDNKQSREIPHWEMLLPQAQRIREQFVHDLEEHNRNGYNLYKHYVEQGIPRELARCFLEVNAYTRYMGTVDLHNLFHFLRLRLHSHAQYEVQEYARAILMLIEPIVPVAVAAFKESL